MIFEICHSCKKIMNNNNQKFYKTIKNNNTYEEIVLCCKCYKKYNKEIFENVLLLEGVDGSIKR